MRKKEGRPISTLATGQIWKVAQSHVLIFRVGRKLIHYRVMATEPQKRGGTTVTTIAAMNHLLRTRKAKLVWPHP